jgi:hypothetical protein
VNSGSRRAAVWIGIVLLFFGLRVPLLIAREAFFDEIVSVWFAHQPLGQLWTTLRNNSESILYFAVAHLWPGFDVMDGRVLSLLFGLATLALFWWLREPLAALLIAAFPAHVFFSTEARAYALFALLIGIATVALRRERYLGAAIALVLAAYAHGYGVLFFPLPFVLAVLRRWTSRRGEMGPARESSGARERSPLHRDDGSRRLDNGDSSVPSPRGRGEGQGEGLLIPAEVRDVRSAAPRGRRVLRGFLASALCGVLFLPGFWLASVQPRGSLAWMEAGSLGERLTLVAKSLLQLGYAAEYEPVFLTSAPLLLQLLSAVLVAIVVIAALRRSAEARFYALVIAVPLLAIVVFAIAGKTFYFPTRFESTLSFPFAMLVACGLAALPRKASVGVLSTLVVAGTFVAWTSAADHAAAPPNPYRALATFSKTAPAELPLVASGYAYIEVRSAVQPREVIPYPGELAVHPGWPGEIREATLESEAGTLPPRFLWVGPASGDEARILRRHYDLRARATAGPIVAAEAVRRP